MKKIIIAVCAVALLAGNLTANEPAATKNSQPTPTATKTAAPVPHCEVPCGIYADQMRFQMNVVAALSKNTYFVLILNLSNLR
jgi:hypothetical protein